MGKVVQRPTRAAAEPGLRPRKGWARAEQTLHTFLAQVEPTARHLLLCHSDADGLASGVVLRRALERSGRSRVEVLATGKGESAWSTDLLERVASRRPDALFVLDLGARSRPIFPGIPTLLIDHHRPLGVPPGALLITSYRWRPVPCTAALVYRLGTTLADITDLEWVAAVGVIGELGDDATLPPLPQARERYGGTAIRETTVLVNAARRSDSGDPTPALQALLAAHEPADITEGRLPQAQALGRLRRAFNAALGQARRAAPVFGGRVALVRVRSPYQVHPVLARIWCARLPRFIVMVANEGYLAGRVNFSLRTALDVNLLDFLQAFRHGLDATEFGYGHDKATGGSLSREDWQRLLASMGFPKSASGQR